MFDAALGDGGLLREGLCAGFGLGCSLGVVWTFFGVLCVGTVVGQAGEAKRGKQSC